MCVRVDFLTFNIVLHNKALPKLTGDFFLTPIIIKNQIKAIFKFSKYCLQFFCSRLNFFFQKQAKIGLLKSIGIPKIFTSIFKNIDSIFFK